MPRNKSQQHVNLSRTTTAERLCFYLFPVSVSFPAFPYARKDVRVLICLETPNGAHNQLLNFSRQIEALSPAIRSH